MALAWPLDVVALLTLKPAPGTLSNQNSARQVKVS